MENEHKRTRLSSELLFAVELSKWAGRFHSSDLIPNKEHFHPGRAHGGDGD